MINGRAKALLNADEKPLWLRVVVGLTLKCFKPLVMSLAISNKLASSFCSGYLFSNRSIENFSLG
ncbi:hypothetical protein VCSRO74_3585 [Vibrio cholerae]|nr:hypothetical protein VCSRO74_3585 [Vibrio cholerae]